MTAERSACVLLTNQQIVANANRKERNGRGSTLIWGQQTPSSLAVSVQHAPKLRSPPSGVGHGQSPYKSKYCMYVIAETAISATVARFALDQLDLCASIMQP